MLSCSLISFPSTIFLFRLFLSLVVARSLLFYRVLSPTVSCLSTKKLIVWRGRFIHKDIFSSLVSYRLFPLLCHVEKCAWKAIYCVKNCAHAVDKSTEKDRHYWTQYTCFFSKQTNFINFRWHAHCFPSIFIKESLPSYVTNRQTAGSPSVTL